MTQHSMVSIVAEIPIGEVEEIRDLIGDTLHNPASEEFAKSIDPNALDADGDDPFLHFMSLHAIAGSAGTTGYLIFEFSADGEADAAIGKIADRTGHLFVEIFSRAKGFQKGDDIAAFWRKSSIRNGVGIGDDPGIIFAGTPGLSVRDIRREKRLADRVAELLSSQGNLSPLERLEDVRSKLNRDEWEFAFTPPPPEEIRPKSEPGATQKIRALLWPIVKGFLWPLLLASLLVSILLVWPAQWVWESLGPIVSWHVTDWIRVVGQLLGFAGATLGLSALFSAIVLGLLYAKFRKAEDADWVSDRRPDDTELAAINARENATGYVQNHMISHTVRKPGWLRKVTLRLAFVLVGQLTALNPRVGHLGDIGTIHFARWITIPGTRDFVFLSNYGGSWESYFEDFITKEHEGLTSVWSNAVGFPRSKNLMQLGATDGERFKRYARQSMTRTPFWYSAYPKLSTANIRANHQIRRGIAEARGEADAVEWLGHFGSRPRSHDKLETSQMQSLLFGGMGFKPDGSLLLLKLSDDVAHNRVFLGMLMPYIAFGDGRYYAQKALVTFASSPSGLQKLGMTQDTLDTFPHAFRDGMNSESRGRILGDTGNNARDNWEWGNKGNDLALLVYGGNAQETADLEQYIRDISEPFGIEIEHRVALVPIKKGEPAVEPFGFVDGVSQPAMRGTYRGLRNSDPIHLVEPGEFVLGYPDNRGNIPPAPTMDPQHDPDKRLPVAGEPQGYDAAGADNPRLPAYNGSFLVIRQLFQHVDRFDKYCMEEGAKLKEAFPEIPVSAQTPQEWADFVGAKLIGRWKDGSSLVRNPYISKSQLKGTSSIRPDNDFLFGTEDAQGLKCPFGAHVRRANPRESFKPGSEKQLGISNRHRLLRVGRGYRKEGGDKAAGLMFMCLNADLERQFELVQQTWMTNTKFHGLDAEVDPIAVNGSDDQKGFTIPTRRGPVVLGKMEQFVSMRGGGYFFVPGRQLLEYFAEE